ncbi:hypothetical protein LX32DRAFT_656893 [Colletotrichum zoysiae]|uniref:Uncharacterized protein n=1 Tax=Colletotrichum zoysiae TaxID=1216348 RepID=A0AAD9LWA0_9PEZI|nr:hypothetical protein LX32DRAFT_656893 [Colletotrichum zoysiae]
MDDQDLAAEIDPEMAAFMGFASFGTQPAAKKRKYNHRTDAVSSASGPAGHPSTRAPVVAAATGANQTVLAPRTPRASTTGLPPPVDTDEIALDDENDADAAAGDEDQDQDQDPDDGGAKIYSDPTIAPALAHAQSLIDELSTSGGNASALPARPEVPWGKEMGSAPTAMPTRERHAEAATGHPPRGGRPGYRQQRSDGKPWWEGYYDHASNENPWERLEKKAGVQSRGTWLSRGQAQTV